MVIDHIGIVVKSLDSGIKAWKTFFGYKEATEVVENKRQGVRVVFLKKSGSLTVKLLEPISPSSPVYSFSMKGGGLHHLCFKGENLNADLKMLSGKGARVLVPPEPGEAFENENIAFVYVGHGLNVELIDTDKKSCQILD